MNVKRADWSPLGALGRPVCRCAGGVWTLPEGAPVSSFQLGNTPEAPVLLISLFFPHREPLTNDAALLLRYVYVSGAVWSSRGVRKLNPEVRWGG